ncbi:Rossmann-like domain-containing protein [Sedimenticola sp.]|uniref:Rossmann-like domain-containing protein n=1 Tax=Sedimenticola sp. TaxID=1940285 RepID=UPI003D12716A
MTYLSQYQALVTQIDDALQVPSIEQILLPREEESSDIKDNFGFVILSDGSTGPFYICLGKTRDWIQQSDHHPLGESPIAIARLLDGVDLPRSALALGAFNAVSQYLMKQAGFDPSTLGKRSDSNVTENRIGLVGFFRPLVERYLAQGKRVTIIEQQPERVPEELEVSVFTTPEALADCDTVFCTASTLINNTIDSIIQATGDAQKIHLIGPSSSGLPDLLFALGIRSTGGLMIDRPEQLKRAIDAGESWGSCGHKYQLFPSDYPGITALLLAATSPHVDGRRL